ncbi:MAG: ATP-binding protein [Myxococcota bacterium]
MQTFNEEPISLMQLLRQENLSDNLLYMNELQYLQDEMSWIKVRIHRLIHEQGLLSLTGRAHQLLTAKIDHTRTQERALRTQINVRLAAHRDAGRPTALCRLCDAYALDSFERMVLLLAASTCFSNNFRDLFTRLCPSETSAGLMVESIFTFAELSFEERISRRGVFSPRSALLSHDLIKVDFDRRYSTPSDLLDACIDLCNRTFDRLVGREGLADDFIDFSSICTPRATMDDVVLQPEHKRRILSVIEQHSRYLEVRRQWGFDDVISYGRGVMMLFHGAPGTGKTMTAHAVASHMGKAVLNVDIPTFVANKEAGRFLPGLFREAQLHNAILFFDECESLFADRRSGNSLMTMLLTELERFEGVAILATNLPESLDEALDRRVLVRLAFDPPDPTARQQIWQRLLPPGANLADDVRFPALARQFPITGGYIKNAVLMALASAVYDNPANPCICQAHLLDAAQAQTRIQEKAERIGFSR